MKEKSHWEGIPAVFFLTSELYRAVLAYKRPKVTPYVPGVKFVGREPLVLPLEKIRNVLIYDF